MAESGRRIGLLLGKRLERIMSGIKTTKTPLSAIKTARPQGDREEPPVRWPSVASSGAGAYVSHPQPKDGATVPETGAEG
jgi:hypothetical protein